MAWNSTEEHFHERNFWRGASINRILGVLNISKLFAMFVFLNFFKGVQTYFFFAVAAFVVAGSVEYDRY